MNDQNVDDVLERLLERLVSDREADVEAFLRDFPDVRAACLKRLERLELAGLLERRARTSREVPALGPGDELLDGRYRLVELVGEGGMGLVWRAFDRSLQRVVALKTIRLDEHSDDSPSTRSLLPRFLRESRLTGQLEHPNIVPVHLLAEDSGTGAFLVMKLVQGETLATLIRRLEEEPVLRAAYPFERLVRIVIAVCDALRYAHSAGVVHRDLKPSNVMVGEFGEVQVMDWGLARLLGESDTSRPGGDPMRSPELSGTGDVFGTPSYMSPEQANARRDVIAATDVFGAGALLHCLLAGHPPYRGCPDEVLRRAKSAELSDPEFRTARAPVPFELREVCLRAMAEHPEARYASIAELAADLEAFLALAPGRAWRDRLPTRAWKSVRRHPLASMAALALLATGSATLYASRQATRAATVEQTRTLELLAGAVEDIGSIAPIPLVEVTEDLRAALAPAPGDEWRDKMGAQFVDVPRFAERPANHITDLASSKQWSSLEAGFMADAPLAWARASRDQMLNAFESSGYDLTQSTRRTALLDTLESGQVSDETRFRIAFALQQLRIALGTIDGTTVPRLDEVDELILEIDGRPGHAEVWHAFVKAHAGDPSTLRELIRSEQPPSTRLALLATCQEALSIEEDVDLWTLTTHSAPQLLLAQARRATRLLLEGSPEIAIRHSEAARALAPESPTACALHSLVLADLEELDEAEALAERAVKLNDRSFSSWSALGHATFLVAMRDLDEDALRRAERAFERSIDLGGGSAEFLSLATVCARQGDWNRVCSLVRDAAMHDSDDQNMARLALAVLDRRAGRGAARGFALDIIESGRGHPPIVAELGRMFELESQFEHAARYLGESAKRDPTLKDELSYDPSWQWGKILYNLPVLLGFDPPRHVLDQHHTASSSYFRGEFQRAYEFYRESLVEIPTVERDLGKAWYEITNIDVWGSYRMAARAAVHVAQGDGFVHVPRTGLIWNDRALVVETLQDREGRSIEIPYVKAENRPHLRDDPSWNEEYRTRALNDAVEYLGLALAEIFTDMERARPVAEHQVYDEYVGDVLREKLLAPALDAEVAFRGSPTPRVAYEAFLAR